MRITSLVAFLCALVSLTGCGSDDPEPQKPLLPPGSLKLNFSVTNGLRMNPTLMDPLRGTVTLPTTNKLVVRSGEETEATIMFDLVF